MRRAKSICYDRLPPTAALQQQRVMMIGGRTRAISPKGKQWVNGSRTLRSLGGAQSGRRDVR